MTSAQVIDLKGKKVGEVALAEHVFAIEPNIGVMHTAVVRQLANARVGTACAKTRSEVRGGGRKPWRQKGTGRARAGSIRSPLWAGGGVTFGPRPRDYSSSLPKKVRELALKSALAARANELVVVKDFNQLGAKTKQMAAVIEEIGLADQKVLLILDFACDKCKEVERAARNIKGVKVISIHNLNTKDIIDCDKILTTERTVEAINNRFKQVGAKAEQAPAKAKTTRKASTKEVEGDK
jgi:large subunit ribosomal protein L4